MIIRVKNFQNNIALFLARLVCHFLLLTDKSGANGDPAFLVRLAEKQIGFFCCSVRGHFILCLRISGQLPVFHKLHRFPVIPARFFVFVLPRFFNVIRTVIRDNVSIIDR